MSGTAVFIEEIVDPRARPPERTIRRGDVHLQQFELIGRLRALIHFDPDAWLLRNDFTLAVTGAAARAVSQLLRTSLRADILHVPEHAIPAGLAAEHR